jgi:signal transduction histidine kinase
VYTDAANRNATYTNLDAGEYVFEVKASNNDGVWNEVPTALHIIITPPYWQSWWFKAAMIFCVAAVIFSIYFYRTKEILRLQQIRNEIASDLHDDIGSTLNSISIYSQVLKNRSSVEIPELSFIGESARKVIDSMSDIVWTINPENDSFEKIIFRMRSLTHSLMKAKKIEYSFKADENLNELKMTIEMRRNFYLIFKEGINNLVKYSLASHVSVSLLSYGKEIELMIRDNGIGFNTHDIQRGNGLMNMQRRALEMKARLKIESVIGAGTSLQLLLRR